MHYRRPPYEEYIKDWHFDMERLEMVHKCGFVGRWLPVSSRPSGIRPFFIASLEAQNKFSEMMDEQGYTDRDIKIQALSDILRQVEEIYVRDFKKIREERLKDPEYLKKHLAPEPAPKKHHWAPVSNLYRKLANNYNRFQGR